MIDTFNNISKIIERDSKATTYKFALLRGVIDIIQDNSPYIKIHSDFVEIPTGLMIEKWLLYYYPILASKTEIPQINGKAKLAFFTQFIKIINYYDSNGKGGFSAFYNDLKNNGIPYEIGEDFIRLSKIIRDTITKMPMKYIGRSISNEFYSIFNFKPQNLSSKTSSIDISFLILNFGTFSIHKNYYEAFKILGSFINGQDSILFKWAEFSVNASGKNLSVENVLNRVLISPITERDVNESKKLYKSILKKQGTVYCVWTEKRITTYDVDHMIPFSIWKNNDLWNLLPSRPSINNKKRDKIPSPELIDKQKDLILEYWNLINDAYYERFSKEITLALLGNKSYNNWQSSGINQLQNTCNYLISNRGYEPWSI